MVTDPKAKVGPDDEDDPRLAALYSLGRDVLDRDYERFKRLDEKTNRFLVAISIIVALGAVFVKWFLDVGVKPANCLDRVVFVAGSLYLLCSVLAWLATFLAMKLTQPVHLCFDQKAIDDFQNNSLNEVYRGYAKTLKEMADTNETQLATKVRRVKCAQLLIFIAGIIMIIFLVLTLIRGMGEFTTQVSSKAIQNMADNQKTGSESTSDSGKASQQSTQPSSTSTTKTGVNPTIRILNENDQSVGSGGQQKHGDGGSVNKTTDK